MLEDTTMYAVDRYIKDYSLIDLKSYIHEQERDSLLSSSSSSFSRLSVSKIGIISYIGPEAVPDATHTQTLIFQFGTRRRCFNIQEKVTVHS
jgi:hypothetical protein